MRKQTRQFCIESVVEIDPKGILFRYFKLREIRKAMNKRD